MYMPTTYMYTHYIDMGDSLCNRVTQRKFFWGAMFFLGPIKEESNNKMFKDGLTLLTVNIEN